jgi:hypothetical protein
VCNRDGKRQGPNRSNGLAVWLSDVETSREAIGLAASAGGRSRTAGLVTLTSISPAFARVDHDTANELRVCNLFNASRAFCYVSSVWVTSGVTFVCLLFVWSVIVLALSARALIHSSSVIG